MCGHQSQPTLVASCYLDATLLYIRVGGYHGVVKWSIQCHAHCRYVDDFKVIVFNLMILFFWPK